MKFHKQALDEFRVAKYDELLTRAEAAEKQLAELIEGDDGLTLLVVACGLRLELAEAQARIAELEGDLQIAREMIVMLEKEQR